MFKSKFFIMSEKFHACFAEKNWRCLIVHDEKKKWGINFGSSVIKAIKLTIKMLI